MVRKGSFACFVFLLIAASGFAVTWPTADLTYPHGGETFRPGQTVHVQWNVTTNDIPICEQEIYLRVNGVAYLQGQFNGESRDFNWVVPNIKGKAYIAINLGCEAGPNKYESFNLQVNHAIVIMK